ncbi:MAG: hypothetical protein Q7I92_14950 [Humidesulfovibrio sp.]|nr:hypothetical protein [Humidesulfovibrio sp.]
MKLPFGKPGISRFIFVALLLVFNWPLLSIPASKNLFAWLFTAWGLAIALLFLAAQGTRGTDAEPPRPAESVAPAESTEPGAGAGGEGGDV